MLHTEISIQVLNFVVCKFFRALKVNRDLFSSAACYEFKDYIGNDITFFSGIDSAIQCHKKCQGIDECKFWSWIETDPGAKQCWIKGFIVSSNNLGSQGQSVVSGPKSCGKTITKIIQITFLVRNFNFTRNMSS